MSPPNSENSSGSDAPNIYVGLLFVAVAALITGIIFLTLELDSLGWTNG